MDEKPVQLLAEARNGITSQSSGIRYQDNEYVRNGTCSIFLFTEPLEGWRYTEAKEQRTRIDWVESIKWLLDEQYPDAEQVIMVCDNLNTHKIASLYEAFPPDEALRIAKRLRYIMLRSMAAGLISLKSNSQHLEINACLSDV